MNLSHTLHSLSPRAAEERRRQLESCFDYLLEHESGPLDQNPDAFEFSLQERCLNEKGFEQVHRLEGRVEGNTDSDGLVKFVRTQVVPYTDALPQHWNIVFAPDSIVCERWNGDEDGDPYSCRRETLSRHPDIPSQVEEWKLAGLL